jgi:DNA-3-methyladenine glycosylase II
VGPVAGGAPGRTEGRIAVALPGPVDVAASVDFFRRNGDDLLDRWDGQHLVRTAPVGGRSIAYWCAPCGGLRAPLLAGGVEDVACAPAIERAIRASFVAAPPSYAELKRRDPVIGLLDVRYSGVRPVLQLDFLGALVRCISAQQVNLRWAVTTRQRLAEAFGRRHDVGPHIVYSLDAARLANVTVAAVRRLQFTTRKAEYIIAIAREIAAGDLGLEMLAGLADEEVVGRLTAVRGIGRWTAEWVLCRTLGRPCVVAGDLGVRKAVGLAYLDDRLPSEAEVRRATEHWGEAALVAQTLLLHGLGAGVLAEVRAKAEEMRTRPARSSRRTELRYKPKDSPSERT